MEVLREQYEKEVIPALMKKTKPDPMIAQPTNN